MASLQSLGASGHVHNEDSVLHHSEFAAASVSLATGKHSPPTNRQTARERAKIASLLEQAGRKDLAIHYMGCRSWNPDNPFRCAQRWTCPPCGWVQQQHARDQMNARARILQPEHPNDLFAMTTINAPRGHDLQHEVEMLGKTRQWIRRKLAKKKESAWSTCLGTYFFTDFAPRMRRPHDLFAHDHAVHVFDGDAVHRWVAQDAARRESLGKRGYRQLVWALLVHGLRRDVALAFSECCPREFAQDQARKKHPERFFHAAMINANAGDGCETFIPGLRPALLKDLREIAEYSWATDPRDEKRTMTIAQRVQIQCLKGRRMRGGSGVLHGVPGIAALAKSIQRGRIIGQRMADQLRADADLDALLGIPGSQKGVLSCSS